MKSYVKPYLKIGMLVIFAFISIISFQNCGSNFESKTSGGANNTVASTPTLTAPTIVLSSNPDLVNLNSYLIEFSISGVSRDLIQSVTCQLKNEPAQDCLSGSIKYSKLTDGDHSVLIKATTTSNISSEVIKLFRIDTTPPIIVVATPPPERSSERSMSIGFNVTDAFSGVNKSECSFDNEAYATCTSPKSFTNLLSGPHTLKIRSSDMAGNVSLVKELGWTVDFSIPTVTISQAQAAFSNSTSASFTFSGATIVTYQCQVDGLGFADCVSPKNFTGLTAGNHKFEVKGKNATGTSSAVAQSLWKIDQTAPSIPILTQNVNPITNQKSAQFNFSATDDSGIQGYQCAVDSYNYTTCSPPFVLTEIADGNHVFRVRSIDLATNTSQPTEFIWTIDSIPPSEPKILTTIGSDSSTVTISFSSVDVGGSGIYSFKCVLDGVVSNPCSSPITLSKSTSGLHTLDVFAVDKASNTSPKGSSSWTIADVALPEYGLIKYNSTNSTIPVDQLARPQLFTDSQKKNIFVSSSCGLFQSKDGGSNFLPLPIKVTSAPRAIAVENSNIYIGTVNGFYVSSDFGKSFVNTLNAKIANTIFQNSTTPPYRCTGISFGTSFGVNNVAVSGNLVVVGTDVGLWISHDGGITFQVPHITSGNYIIPPLQISSIDIVNGEIYASAGNGDLSGSNTGLEPNGECSSNNKIPLAALIVSKDGGFNFTSIASGRRAASILRSRRTPATIYALGSSSDSDEQGFMSSLDSGKTFSNPNNSLIRGFGNQSRSPNVLLETSTALFSQILEFSGSGGQLYRSQDFGISWSDRIIFDSTMPASEVGSLGVVDDGKFIFSLTNNGVYSSEDKGLNFKRISKFSSGYCIYPWWNRLTTSTSSGKNIYLLGSSLLASKDGGKTFSNMSKSGVPVIWELSSIDSALYATSYDGIYVSIDGGESFTGPNDFIKNPSGATIYANSLANSSSAGKGAYISFDGTDQRYQIDSILTQRGSFTSSAVSFGKRIIAGAYGIGFVVYENGVKIYENNMTQSGASQYVRIRYVNGVVYALGREMWASRDQGLTWLKVDGAPEFPKNILEADGKIVTTTGSEFDYIWESKDNGQTFSPWLGQLNPL